MTFFSQRRPFFVCLMSVSAVWHLINITPCLTKTVYSKQIFLLDTVFFVFVLSHAITLLLQILGADAWAVPQPQIFKASSSCAVDLFSYLKVGLGLKHNDCSKPKLLRGGWKKNSSQLVSHLKYLRVHMWFNLLLEEELPYYFYLEVGYLTVTIIIIR